TAALERSAAQLSIPLADARAAFAAAASEDGLYLDAWHPTPAGHRVYAATVAEALDRAGLIGAEADREGSEAGGLAARAYRRILVPSCARLQPARKGVVVTLPVGPAEAPNDDLFRPSLPEGIDVGAFDKPWRPMSLAVAGFFGGLLAAGPLFALNWSRLGDP